MSDIYNSKIIDLIPSNLRNDPDIQAAAKALDLSFSDLVESSRSCLILPNLDEQPSDVVDILAWQFNVDFYDPTLPLTQRRELVKNSPRWKKKKGTPSAVEELIISIFDDGEVEEWFDYGGSPYHFRVMTTNPSATEEQAQEFIRAVESVKNLRSRLDEVILIMTDEMKLYFGGVLHMGDNLTIKQVV